MPTVAQLLQDHVTLSIACLDRLYLNGYVPSLQTAGGLVAFMQHRLRKPIASPVVMAEVSDRLRSDIKDFTKANRIPLIQFKRGERKDDVAAVQRRRFHSKHGVVFVGVAREKARSFKAAKAKPTTPDSKVVFFRFTRQYVHVNHYYFYVQDREWGPGFIKLCSYFPFPIKLCINGHEWAKQQLDRRGIAFEALDNGFLWTERPEELQEICDSLSPADVLSFFHRWASVLPWPLTPDDRRVGYDHSITIWQLERSLTHVFDRPLRGRQFFEQIIRDNLDLGRPDRVRLLFPIRLNKRTPPPPYGYRTRVVTYDVNPSLHVDYKRCHVKQYFKEQRALRTETTINRPKDFRVNKGIENLRRLQDIGDHVNRAVLDIETVADDCSLSRDEFDYLNRPTEENGQHASALRFGDPRVMALLQCLCMLIHVFRGFRNRDLRPHLAALLGLDPDSYPSGRMTYDLRRLRLKGLISRVPGTHRYALTEFGRRAALFHAKLYLRVLQPGWASLRSKHPRPRSIGTALRRVDAEIDRMASASGLKRAA